MVKTNGIPGSKVFSTRFHPLNADSMDRHPHPHGLHGTRPGRCCFFPYSPQESSPAPSTAMSAAPTSGSSLQLIECVTRRIRPLVHRYNFDGSLPHIHPEILKSNYHISPDLRGGFWHRNSASHFSDVHYVDAYTLKPLTTLNLVQMQHQFESVLLGTDESGSCRVREIGARYHRVFSPTGKILEEKSIPGEITDSRTNSVTRDGYQLSGIQRNGWF